MTQLTISNIKLMNEGSNLVHDTTPVRDEIIMIQFKSYLLHRAFGVKWTEYDNEFIDYERHCIWGFDDFRKELLSRINDFKYYQEQKHYRLLGETQINIIGFFEVCEFISPRLAAELKVEYSNELEWMK